MDGLPVRGISKLMEKRCDRRRISDGCRSNRSQGPLTPVKTFMPTVLRQVIADIKLERGRDWQRSAPVEDIPEADPAVDGFVDR